MKATLTKIIALFFFIMIMGYSFAQAPQAFNYQAVARDASGNILENQSIKIRFKIHKTSATGTITYSEVHNPTTNDFGLFSLMIGTGSQITGTFNTIDWGKAQYWLEVEMDPTGGATYTDMGTSQLLTVPYAMYAERAGTKISAFQPLGCQTLANVTTSYQKVGDMGTFTKTNENTVVELVLQTTFSIATFAGGSIAAIFELRVDNVATTIGNATIFIREAVIRYPGSITGVFTGLASGVHTVSLWAKVASTGTGTNAMWDYGCWNNQGVNNVLIKEY